MVLSGRQLKSRASGTCLPPVLVGAHSIPCKTVPGGIQFHRINGLLMEIIAPTVGYFGMETADHLGQ